MFRVICMIKINMDILKEGEIEIDGAGAKQMDQKRFWRDISYVPQAKQLSGSLKPM